MDFAPPPTGVPPTEPASDDLSLDPPDGQVSASPLTRDPLTPGLLPMPTWFAVLSAVCAIGLVPWIIYLALELPAQSRSAHYDVTWVGFDIAMFLALGATALAAKRRSTWTEPLATASAVLLLTDAWFDVTSASDSVDRAMALASAVVIEVPLAVLCGWVAQNTERLRRRAYRRLFSRAYDAERTVAAYETATLSSSNKHTSVRNP